MQHPTTRLAGGSPVYFNMPNTYFVYHDEAGWMVSSVTSFASVRDGKREGLAYGFWADSTVQAVFCQELTGTWSANEAVRVHIVGACLY